MVAYSLDGGLHVGKVEGLIRWMGGVPGHPELLPHQDAVLVAQFVETVAFRNASAPEPEEVDPALGGIPKFRLHPFVIGAEHRLRYPVAPPDKKRPAVHEEEFRGVGGGAGSADFTDAEPGREGIAASILGDCLESQGVEVLFPLVPGPP